MIEAASRSKKEGRMARATKSVRSGSRRSLRSLKAKAVSESKGQNILGGKPKKTPRLFESACKGTHIPEVIIEM
jgi:hypothetical protein